MKTNIEKALKKAGSGSLCHEIHDKADFHESERLAVLYHRDAVLSDSLCASRLEIEDVPVAVCELTPVLPRRFEAAGGEVLLFPSIFISKEVASCTTR